MWSVFLVKFNSRSLWIVEGVSNIELQLFTNAAAVGYWAISGVLECGCMVRGLACEWSYKQFVPFGAFPYSSGFELWEGEIANR